jgi:hypothetical protein
MKEYVNGILVEVFANPDGTVSSDAIRKTGGIPGDRPLILHTPDGGNRIINPGENVLLASDQYFSDIPKHKRGKAATPSNQTA